MVSRRPLPEGRDAGLYTPLERYFTIGHDADRPAEIECVGRDQQCESRHVVSLDGDGVPFPDGIHECAGPVVGEGRQLTPVFVAGDVPHLVDDHPVGPVVPVGLLGGPDDALGKWISGVELHEVLDVLQLLRPPAGVVPPGLRLEHEIDAQPVEVLEERLHVADGVEPVRLPVHDEERFVNQVRQMHHPVGSHPRVQEHARIADERQEAGPRCRVPDAQEVHARASVGDTRGEDAVLVHVVRFLQLRKDAAQVLHLACLPPQ